MEACGSAHHWARMLTGQGHEVKLLPAARARPFVLREKTNARDAHPIWADVRIGPPLVQLAIDEQLARLLRDM